jgi:hypothetical protein
MVSGRRLLDFGSSLNLSVGVGLGTLVGVLPQATDAPTSVPLVIGVLGSFTTAYVVLGRYPETESGVVWRFGLLTLALFVLGNVLAADGSYAPTSERSLLTIGVIWLVSMAVAYAVVVSGGYRWLKQRIASR